MINVVCTLLPFDAARPTEPAERDLLLKREACSDSISVYSGTTAMVAGAKRPAAASAAGPRKKPRKDAAAGTSLPSASAPAASKPTARQPRRRTHARLAPLKPATNQTVTGRPTGAGLANPTREIRGRNVIFVTRKTGLGAYMKRCKALLVEEG